MGAVLARGPDAMLSHHSAAELWGIGGRQPRGRIDPPSHPPSLVDVSVPAKSVRRHERIRLHRRNELSSADRTLRERIPVTTPARTLIDLATRLGSHRLEAAVNEADSLGLIDPERLRRIAEERLSLRGARVLRNLLDRRTFTLTDSELERRFLRLVRRIGLPIPLDAAASQRLSGRLLLARVAAGHGGGRSPLPPHPRGAGRRRDHAHAEAGVAALRFTHAQITFEETRVTAVLRSVAEHQRLLLLGARAA
jgi:hypothetical protein